MNIKRIIKEELDKKIPYEYYINKILDEVEEYIDIDKLKKKEYLFKVVDGVYKSLITLPPFTGSFNEKYFYRVNDEKEMYLLILNILIDRFNIEKSLNESDELELNTYEKNISYIRSMKTYEYIKNNIDMFDRVYSNTEYIEKTGERLTWRPTGEDLSINNLWMKKTIDRLQFLFMDDDSNKRFNEELIEYYDKVDYDSSLGHLKDREDEIKIGVLVYRIIRDIVGY